MSPPVRGTRRASPNARWPGGVGFLEDLCTWAMSLPEEQLPPRETEAAQYFTVTRRTLLRYLSDSGVGTWEDFERHVASVWRDALNGQ